MRTSIFRRIAARRRCFRTVRARGSASTGAGRRETTGAGAAPPLVVPRATASRSAAALCACSWSTSTTSASTRRSSRAPPPGASAAACAHESPRTRPARSPPCETRIARATARRATCTRARSARCSPRCGARRPPRRRSMNRTWCPRARRCARGCLPRGRRRRCNASPAPPPPPRRRPGARRASAAPRASTAAADPRGGGIELVRRLQAGAFDMTDTPRRRACEVASGARADEDTVVFTPEKNRLSVIRIRIRRRTCARVPRGPTVRQCDVSIKTRERISSLVSSGVSFRALVS